MSNQPTSQQPGNPSPDKLTNPPKDQTTLTAPAPKRTMVRVKAVRAFKLPDPDKPNDRKYDKIVEPDHEVEVTEEKARELCDATTKGPYGFYGTRPDEEVVRPTLMRAVRVA